MINLENRDLATLEACHVTNNVLGPGTRLPHCDDQINVVFIKQSDIPIQRS